MGIHENVETISGWSAKTKCIVAGVILLVIAAILGGCVYVGWRWAKSDDALIVTEADKRAAVAEASAEQHLANETQLAAQNSILKKQNEALIETYKNVDTATEKKAADDFAAREVEHTKDLDSIDAEASHDAIICGTCARARAAGRPLSAEFCQRCEGQK